MQTRTAASRHPRLTEDIMPFSGTNAIVHK